MLYLNGMTTWDFLYFSDSQIPVCNAKRICPSKHQHVTWPGLIEFYWLLTRWLFEFLVCWTRQNSSLLLHVRRSLYGVREASGLGKDDSMFYKWTWQGRFVLLLMWINTGWNTPDYNVLGFGGGAASVDPFFTTNNILLKWCFTTNLIVSTYNLFHTNGGSQLKQIHFYDRRFHHLGDSSDLSLIEKYISTMKER